MSCLCVFVTESEEKKKTVADVDNAKSGHSKRLYKCFLSVRSIDTHDTLQ